MTDDLSPNENEKTGADKDTPKWLKSATPSESPTLDLPSWVTCSFTPELIAELNAEHERELDAKLEAEKGRE